MSVTDQIERTSGTEIAADQEALRRSCSSSQVSCATSNMDIPQSVFFHYPHCGGTVPPARWAHTAAAVGSKLLVYGGVGTAVFDDLHVLDTDIMVWRSASTTTLRPKERPGKRMCHGSAVVGKHLWLFGGQHGRKYVRDLFSLNTETLQWQQHNLNSLPSARAGHSLTATSDKLYIFGGQGKKFTNDLHVFHIPSMQWQELQPTGRAPTARRGHSLTWDGRSSLILFGGSTATAMENSLHVYNIENNQWTTPILHGSCPAPRTQHTASFVAPHLLLVFGGCNAQGVFFNDTHVLDTNTFTWHRPHLLGTAPPPRYHHSACIVNGKLLIYGGINSKQTLDGVVHVETKFSSDISHVAEELFKMTGRSAAGGAETSLAADMMKVQLRDLLVKRNMEEAQIIASQRAQQAQEQLGRTKEEKEDLASEVAQLRLMLAEADEERRRLSAQSSDLQGRLQREATAAEAARVLLEQSQAEARSLGSQLQAAVRVQEGLEKELGIVASRYARTKLERDALLAGRSSRRRTAGASDSGTSSPEAAGGVGPAATRQGSPVEGRDVRESASSSPTGLFDAEVDEPVEVLGREEVGLRLRQLAREMSAAEGVGAAAVGAGQRELEEEVARLSLQLRRMQGDQTALQACSLAELRELVEGMDVAGRVVRDVMIVKTVEEVQQRAGSEQHHCSLCMEAPRGVVFNCGHQTCEQCSVRLVSCPFCRVDITAKIRMFDT